MKVSWQVTGIRHDAFANANRIKAELEKEGDERGKYIHYKLYGMPETISIYYEEIKALREEARKMSDEDKKMIEAESTAEKVSDKNTE